MAKKIKPVNVAGIEFDAMITSDENYTADIPEYPTEDGFNVSDTITLKPIVVSMTLYITNTPVTWLKRHGSSQTRVSDICKQLEELYISRKLVKVVTTDKTYKNMGVTSIAITKSIELGYSRQVAISFKEVFTTKRNTVKIPSYILKSGKTAANAGTATTSMTPLSSNMAASKDSSSNSDSTESKKSILYGIAQNFNFL